MKKLFALATAILSMNCYADPTVIMDNTACKPLSGDNLAGCFTNKADYHVGSRDQSIFMWVDIVYRNGSKGSRYDLGLLPQGHNILISASKEAMLNEKIVYMTATLNDAAGEKIDGCYFMLFPNTGGVQNVKLTGSVGKLRCERY